MFYQVNVNGDETKATLLPPVGSYDMDKDLPLLVSAVAELGFQVRLFASDGTSSGDWTSGVANLSTTVEGPLVVNMVWQPAPATSTLADVEPRVLLRYYVGDVIKPGGSESDAFFADAMLDLMLSGAGYNVFRAAARCWKMRAAEYARLIDFDEGGSARKLSQRYRQALQLEQAFEADAATYDEQRLGGLRVSAKPLHAARLLGECRVSGWSYIDHGLLVVEQPY